MTALQEDMVRYGAKSRKDMPRFQYYFRKIQVAKNPFTEKFYKFFFYRACRKNHIELSPRCKMGGGSVLWSPVLHDHKP